MIMIRSFSISVVPLLALFFVPNGLQAAPGAELWKGLRAGMTAAEASSVLNALPGVKRTKVGKKGGVDAIDIVTDYYGFTVAEQRARPLLGFSSDGLRSVSLYILPRLGNHLCSSEIVEARQLFSTLLREKYKPVEGAAFRFAGDGVDVSLEASVSPLSRARSQQLRGSSANALPDLSAARCASDGGVYGSFVIHYLDARFARQKDDAGEQRVKRAVDDL